MDDKSSMPRGAEDQHVWARELRKTSEGFVDMEKQMNNFFLNKYYGSFLLNLFASIVAKFLDIFLVGIATWLGLRSCRRARDQREKLTDERMQQLLKELDARVISLTNFNDLLVELQVARYTGEGQATVSATMITNETLLDNESRTTVLPDVIATTSIVETSTSSMAILLNDEVAKLNMTSRTLAMNYVSKSAEGGADDRKPLSSNRIRNGFTNKPHRVLGEKSSKDVPDISSRYLWFPFNRVPAFKSYGIRSYLNGTNEGTSGTQSSQSNSSNTSSAFIEDESNCQHLVDIPCTLTCALPSSSSSSDALGDNLKESFRDKFRLNLSDMKDMFSSRILQATVGISAEKLSILRELAIEGMKLDKNFTLQVDRSHLFHYTGKREEPHLLSLKDINIPTILQATYVAGVLTIRGCYLEGAEIRASTSDCYVTLHTVRQKKGLQSNYEVWRCTNKFPPFRLDTIHVFASKKVTVGKYKVTLRSAAFPITNDTLGTVLREWLPTTFLILLIVGQVWVLFTPFIKYFIHLQHLHWIIPLVPVLVTHGIQMLPPSLEMVMKDWLTRVEFLLSSCFRSIVHVVVPDSVFVTKSRKLQSNEAGLGAKKATNQDCKDGPGDANDNGVPPTDPEWMWPCFDRRYSRREKQWLTNKRIASSDKMEDGPPVHPFEVVYVESLDGSKEVIVDDLKPRNALVKIYSKYLLRVIKELLPHQFKSYGPHGEIAAKHLFYVYIEGKLQKVAADSADISNMSTIGTSETQDDVIHVSHLLRFIEAEFGQVIKQYWRMKDEGTISWDMLWTLLPDNEKVIHRCVLSNDKLCGEVVSTRYVYSEKTHTLEVDLAVWDYNCVEYEKHKIAREVPEFSNEQKVTEVLISPLQFQEMPQEMEAALIKRGKKFHEIVLFSSNRYMQCRGLMFRNKQSKYTVSKPSKMMSIVRENVDSRVMIDQRTYAKVKPNRHMATAAPPNEWLRGNFEDSKMAAPLESDPNLIFSPAVVYGYSFSLRKWGAFSIEGLDEIEFNSSAFATLVMNEEMKEMMFCLARHYIEDARVSEEKGGSIDPLSNKGQGCVILCHGPPGTGKTLTAESIAEKLECPLWSLSVSKLVRNPVALERKLLQTFKVASSWRAILLLDEADIYLQTRKYSPLSTNSHSDNAMTGAFLRVIEYYQGVLFLTTNLIASIEPAIYSRISLTVKYEDFSADQSRQVWSTFLERAGITNLSSQFWDEVGKVNFNGRVIRNVVRNAQMLSETSRKPLTEALVLNAKRVMEMAYIGDHISPQQNPHDENYLKTDDRSAQESASLQGIYSVDQDWAL